MGDLVKVRWMRGGSGGGRARWVRGAEEIGRDKRITNTQCGVRLVEGGRNRPTRKSCKQSSNRVTEDYQVNERGGPD